MSSPPPRPPVPPKPTIPVPNLMPSRRLWLIFGIILLLNFFITTVLFAPAQPATVALSYDVFKQQVAVGNLLLENVVGERHGRGLRGGEQHGGDEKVEQQDDAEDEPQPARWHQVWHRDGGLRRNRWARRRARHQPLST